MKEKLTDDGTALDARVVGVRMTKLISAAQSDKTQEAKSNSPEGDARKS